ncbi:HET-domain-containing protein [Pleurostoma richardsiae]|uniref:HET-domain-containing protein n=1 Tax=Pleurostoma richardsiae TaxID=41990 RepID=A0AA38RDY6_9PEZI|nr:HET-domain-containing protein [Pleurostoma richardsiae]
MRLINTITGGLEEFSRNIPAYAILSHTWEEGEEVEFKDTSNVAFCETKRGYNKIIMTCRLAAAAGIRYAWVDTCCIDKSSSAELTEAINSMFRWYERSEICYVFLADLASNVDLRDGLQHCRWVRRGWTLQELIAPDRISFFDREWQNRGSKDEYLPDLARITGIDASVLKKTRSLSEVCVAEKMSWAARRETTRIEDRAYSLLGIFDANMPMLYGEEEKAFRRLQEEIIRTTPDLSILAWKWNLYSPDAQPFHGVLSESPTVFAGCERIRALEDGEGHDFSITNHGIKAHHSLGLMKLLNERKKRYILKVGQFGRDSDVLGICLRKVGVQRFVRDRAYSLVNIPRGVSLLDIAPADIYLLLKTPGPQSAGKTPRLYDVIPQSRGSVLQIDTPPEICFNPIWDMSRFDHQDNAFFASAFEYWIDCAIGGASSVTFEATIYVVSLSGVFRSETIQATIIDYKYFQSEVKAINSLFRHNSVMNDKLMESLVSHGIPQSPAVVFGTSGGRSVVVSMSASEVIEPDICRLPCTGSGHKQESNI